MHNNADLGPRDDSDDDDDDDDDNDDNGDHEEEDFPNQPSVTTAFFVYCVLPLLGVTFLSWDVPLPTYFEPGGVFDPGGVRPSPAAVPPKETDGGAGLLNVPFPESFPPTPAVPTHKSPPTSAPQPSSPPASTKYQQEVDAILKRKKQPSQGKDFAPKQHAQGTEEGGRPGTDVDARSLMDKKISSLRDDYKANPSDKFKALAVAEALRMRDLTFHDGGSAQMEGLEMYLKTIQLINEERDALIQDKKPTNIPKVAGIKGSSLEQDSLNDEMFVEEQSKSIDALLCSTLCALAKMYFMANMFERAVESYDQCLQLDPDYLDALTYRGSTLIILGRYAESAQNYTRVLQLDVNRVFMDTFTGLAKILTEQEDVVPGGWDSIVSVIEEEIPRRERQLTNALEGGTPGDSQNMVLDGLKRMHLAMFSYHDRKTKDLEQAWKHLKAGHDFKIANLPPWPGHEEQRVESIRQVFRQGFWPPGVGSTSRAPIFIIGFVRSGSTLLERVLDAHPLIVGTGEDSVFNGRLDYIRDSIVRASMSGLSDDVHKVVKKLAKEVVETTKERWRTIEANSPSLDDITQLAEQKGFKFEPTRYVDKMLTNSHNVGFIHMLFPKALILHVAREPMDTVFSAYKHDFPPGTLDYTSDFRGLSRLYHCYRDVMEHWDEVLPGRVTHIRYEDLVNDPEGMARAIIAATGLPWDEAVLKFHETKKGVNTLSATQVRKGIYKSGMKSWQKYHTPLAPLVKLIGHRATFDLKTTLPGYKPPTPPSTTSTGETKSTT